jgi:hypothetical protein
MQRLGVVYILWSNIYFHTYHLRSDRDIFIHRFIPVFWHDSLTLIGYRVHISEGRKRDMGAYVIRYTDEDGTFFHNAESRADNLLARGAGMSLALVIHDEAVALRLAKLYVTRGGISGTSKRVEILALNGAPAWSTDFEGNTILEGVN